MEGADPPIRDSAKDLIPRHVEQRVREALEDTRVVAIVGPRQAGKTTLARSIARKEGIGFLTLDDGAVRAFAEADPDGFLEGRDRVVLDEVQRVPDLLLAIKRSVDERPEPGRFLITGSVDLFRQSRSPDSLAGRVETVELLPLSQAELRRLPPSTFIERAFATDFPGTGHEAPIDDLNGILLRGGYPEAQARRSPARRRAWLASYAHALASRDGPELAGIQKTEALTRLIEHAALRSAQLTNLSALASPLSVDGKTVDRWLDLLEDLFVLRRLPAWHRNELKRLIRTPKLHFLDSGLLAAMAHVDERVLETDRSRLGPLLETFVFSELQKYAAIAPEPLRLSHYRDKDKVEVDFVLERQGRIVGIEVKAAKRAEPRDFAGIDRLAEHTGSAFCSGIVLYTGNRLLRTARDRFVVPLSMLWS